MAGKPKAPEKRRDYLLRARVTAKLKARVKRVVNAIEEDESDWLRDAVLIYVEREEKRLGLPPISAEEVDQLTTAELRDMVHGLSEAAAKYKPAEKTKQAAPRKRDAA